MPKNTLFQFITHLKKNTSGADLKQFVLRVNSSNSRYYCIDLPVNEKLKFKLDKASLSLTAHHISVYENENKANPNLSQYHYTAYFQDESGSDYCLHVYFDDNNQLTRSPSLDMLSLNNKAIDISHAEKQFTTLAMQFAYPVIAALKKQQQDCIKELRDEYDSRMAKLNEVWFNPHLTSKDMQALIMPALALSAKLIVLVNSNTLVKEHRFLEAMHKSLQESAKQGPKPVKSELSGVQLEEDSSSTEHEEEPVVHISNNNTPEHDGKDHSSNHVQDFEAIKSLYCQVNKEKNTPQQIENMEALLSLIADFILLHKEHVDLDVLNQLQTFKLRVYETGSLLFKRVLIGEQFDLAIKMPSFYHQITPSMLALALQLQKKSLLEFVLRHADFDISHQALGIGKQTYASAVHACIALSSNKDMGDCFSLLIQYDQSLLTLDDQGKPVILPVLLDSDHPLKKSLLAARDKTLDCLPFLKSMVSVLQNYLQSHQVAGKERELIQGLIKDFTGDINFLQKMKWTPGLRSLRQYSHAAFDRLNKNELIIKIRQEPEIALLQMKLEGAAQGVLQRTNPYQLSVNLKDISKLEKGLRDYLDELDLSQLTYEELKSNVMSMLENSLAILDKKNELLTLSATNKGAYSGSKAVKKAANRQNVLLREIKELSQSNPFIQLLEEVRSQSTLGYGSFFKIQQGIKELAGDLEKMMNLLKTVERAIEMSQEDELLDSSDNPDTEDSAEQAKEELDDVAFPASEQEQDDCAGPVLNFFS
ncbi:hypothetical protein [Legionella erythra]|uniref:Coiled-coil-containing protein n=1 Tax=Legionella erythra TaxID=448 RepID=A0A0W0TXF6_LEGER|nr:hypothetical protein [Legionella erythra]KTD00009.1 coiled-coil-containing protein [Legionella erythra]